MNLEDGERRLIGRLVHPELGLGLGPSWGTQIPLRYVRDGASTAWTAPKGVMITSQIAAVGYTKSDGRLYLSEVDTTTGAILGTVSLGDQYTRDDHNSIAVAITSDGALLACITGHHNPVAGGSNAKYQVYRATNGRISGFGSEYVVTTTITSSNYQQLVVSGSKVWNWTNDDGDNSWRFLRSSDHGVTWTNGIRIFSQGSAPGGGQNQVYSWLAKKGSDRLSFILTAHPTNLENVIRYGEIEMATGAVYTGAGGAPNGANAITAYGSTKAATSYGAIYTPPTGKSVRLNSFHQNGTAICITEFDAVDGGNAYHYLLVWDGVFDIYVASSWSKIAIGSAGTSFDADPASTFFCDLAFSRGTIESGVELFRTSNDGTGNYTLERLTGATFAGPFIAEVLTTAGNGYKLPKVQLIDGAPASYPGFVMRGTYDHYTLWTLDFIPLTGPYPSLTAIALEALGSALVAWWDASYDASLSISGVEVTDWTDRVSAAAMAGQATSADKPDYSASSFNGTPGIIFDGVSDFLSVTPSSLFPTGNAVSEIWAVVRQDAEAADATTRIIFSVGGTGSGDGRRINRSVVGGANRFSVTGGDGSTGHTLMTNVVDFDGYHVVRGLFGGGQVAASIDGSPMVTEPVTLNTAATRSRISAGNSTSALGFWNGMISHVAVFNRKLTRDEAAGVCQYLAERLP